MAIESIAPSQVLFSVFAIKSGDQKPLILIGLSFGRLIEDIVIPYSSEEMFFIDGVPVKASQLAQIKIIKQTDFFARTVSDLHYGIRKGDLKQQELYAKQYSIRLEALLRESGDDVTTQVIKAYSQVIKPKLKDYLPNRESLLDAAVKIFTESVKALSGAT